MLCLSGKYAVVQQLTLDGRNHKPKTKRYENIMFMAGNIGSAIAGKYR